MARTPSSGIDQNGSHTFIDKYWGRVSQFLQWNPAAYICEVNPEYIELMDGLIDGSILPENVSDELFNEIQLLLVNEDCPCLLEPKERALMTTYNSDPRDYEPCSVPSDRLDCDSTVCCNTILLCNPLTECGEEEECVSDGYSTYIFTSEVNPDNGDIMGYVEGQYGTLVHVDGPDLHITELYSALQDGEVIESYFTFQSNYVCAGQTAVEIVCVELGDTWIMMDDESTDTYAAGSKYDIMGFAKTESQATTIRVKRHGCDQCNLTQQPT